MIRGLSPMHDSGTGSSLGTYGNFEIMPLLCPGGFETCTVRIDDRLRYRKNNTDVRTPATLHRARMTHTLSRKPTLGTSRRPSTMIS